MPAELLPCPWCGNPAAGYKALRFGMSAWRISCQHDDCYAQPFVIGHDEAQAALSWNTRAPSRASVPVLAGFDRLLGEFAHALTEWVRPTNEPSNTVKYQADAVRLADRVNRTKGDMHSLVESLTVARERAEVLLGKAEQECASLQVLPRLSRDYFHATYDGGYHEREEGDGRESQRQAFHHGMDCVFNAIERNTPE